MSDQKAASDAGAKKDKPKGDSPILRGVQNGKQSIAVWAHAGADAKTGGHGYFIDKAGKEVNFSVFFNEREVNGGKKQYMRLSAPDGKDEATGKPKHKTLGFGNAVNSNAKNEPVYFDTVVFNVGEGDTAQTFSARVTKACTEAFRNMIGFTQAQLERPKKEREAEAAAEGQGQGEGDAGEGEQAPRARERSTG